MFNYILDENGDYYFDLEGQGNYIHECYVDFILSFKEEINNYVY